MNQEEYILAEMTLATTSLKQCSVFISLRVMELIFSQFTRLIFTDQSMFYYCFLFPFPFISGSILSMHFYWMNLAFYYTEKSRPYLPLSIFYRSLCFELFISIANMSLEMQYVDLSMDSYYRRAYMKKDLISSKEFLICYKQLSIRRSEALSSQSLAFIMFWQHLSAIRNTVSTWLLRFLSIKSYSLILVKIY